MKYKVIFIDEELEQQEQFLDYMDAVGDKLSVKCLFPESTIEEMLAVIEDEKPDAIVSDYILNDMKTDIKYNVAYSGVELLTAYQQMRPGFPCFVLTSFDSDAIVETKDVNLVYVKLLLTSKKMEEDIKVRFCDKVFEQISKYKKSIIDAQSEIDQLIAKRRSGESTLADDERLLELDSFIEKSLDAESKVPDDMKTTENINNLSLMIKKAEELLSKLE